jgi:aminoglycoside phosphotransferase (APT) family kinase protein
VQDGLSIPVDLDDVTAAWATAALAPSHPGVEVASVTVVDRDDGTNRRARLALSYAQGSGPGTLFLKAADPDHTELNAKTGGVFNEPRLFLSDVPLPLEHPAVHLALIDEPTFDFLLVMEDVAERGADPRDATRPLSVEQAADGVRGLARLHSRYWGDRLTAERRLGWVEPFVAWRSMARGIDGGKARTADLLPREVAALDGERIHHECWVPFIGSLGHGPATLLHGDPHIGNTYVLPDDRVGFLDWQVLRRGNQSLDLGYFLQGAVTVEDRRAHEVALVDEYHDALDLPADERPSRDDVWLRYRASVSHGLAIWLATASSKWQRAEVSAALVERYAAAFVDLDTPAAIAQLCRA